MKNMVTTKNKNIKISSLTIANTGVIVVNAKQESLFISFSEIEKVYIQKSKLSFIQQAGIATFLLNVVFNSFLIMSLEMVLISLLLYVPLLVYIKNYKLYRLYLLHKSNALFFRNLKRANIQEHFNHVSTIRNKLFCSRDDSTIPNKKGVKRAAPIRVVDYAMPTLSIA